MKCGYFDIGAAWAGLRPCANDRPCEVHPVRPCSFCGSEATRDGQVWLGNWPSAVPICGSAECANKVRKQQDEVNAKYIKKPDGAEEKP